MKARILFLFLAFNLIGITNANAISQVEIACKSVNYWPVDYATVWPAAIKKRSENPLKYAADYMKGYIASQKLYFKIKDPKAVNIFKQYENYWYLLEADLMYGGGKLNKSAISVQYLAPLMKKCSKYGSN
jgi:hypothetical protein